MDDFFGKEQNIAGAPTGAETRKGGETYGFLDFPNVVEEPAPPLPPTTSMAAMDRLTMELLLNKTHYAKYLSKTDRQKHDEFQEFVGNLRKYSAEMADITHRLTRNPKSTIFSQDMLEAFETYAHTVIRFMELSAMNKDENEEDELFPSSMNKYKIA